MSDLPPLDAPQAYVVVGPDDQRGPYAMELLLGEVLAGRLSEETPVWWPGLSDWTTMGSHAGVSAEIERRRVATTTPAPGWADPVPTGAPQPSYEAQPTVIDVEFVETAPPADQVDQQAYDDLVQRSSTHAQQVERVAGAEQSFLDAASDAVAAAGLTPVGREDSDGRSELSFDGGDGSALTLRIGRFDVADAAMLTGTTVPLEVAATSTSGGVTTREGTGSHGEVVVTTDEWSGRASSSVSLFLGLGQYFDGDLRLDADAVARDIGAVVGVVRRGLSG